jgi:hypothetical protein
MDYELFTVPVDIHAINLQLFLSQEECPKAISSSQYSP